MKHIFATLLCVITNVAGAQSSSLQDLGRTLPATRLPEAIIYTAKEIITLDPARPNAEAIAIVGDRILATGKVAELKKQLGDQKDSLALRWAVIRERWKGRKSAD